MMCIHAGLSRKLGSSLHTRWMGPTQALPPAVIGWQMRYSDTSDHCSRQQHSLPLLRILRRQDRT